MIERREMIHNKPTLGVYFDIDKLTQKYDTGSYGFPGWKIIWVAMNVQNVKGITYLFDGDTDRTLNRHERVWCVAFQSDNRNNLSYIRSCLENSSEFKDVAAPTKFKEDSCFDVDHNGIEEAYLETADWILLLEISNAFFKK